MVTVFFVGLVAAALGGCFWGIYSIEEYLEFRRLARLIDRAEQSKTADLSLSPALLLDTVDREPLHTVQEAGGDVLSIRNQMKNRALALNPEELRQRVAGLLNLKMVQIYEKRIGLTPMEHEAISTPSAVFTSRVPTRVRQYLYEAKRDLFRENWGQCVLDTHKAIEAAYKQLIAEASERDSGNPRNRRRAEEKKNTY